MSEQNYPSDDELKAKYQALRLVVGEHGRDLAELEIEARREAQNGEPCEYEKGTFPFRCYHHELAKMRFQEWA